MYQRNNPSQWNKVIIAAVTVAGAGLLVNSAPASACTMSQATKPEAAFSRTVGLAGSVGTQDAGTATPANSKTRAQGFVGLWDSKLIYQGQVVDEGFDAFHSDGTEILVDQSNPITDNVCLGVWEQTGPATINLKHPSWYFDLSGNLLGTVIIYETLTLDPGCDSFHGTESEDVYDTKGNKIAHYDGSTITAKRIKPI